MAIGSVKELIDYERETIKIAKKHGGGGGSVDLSLIADVYNPERTTQYPANDMVVYEGKLYRATTATLPSAGEFNSTMWDKIPDYDSTQTYNNYDYAVYEGQIYRCDESNVTGEWDSSKWTEVSAEFPEYNSSEVYYAYGSSKCTYEGDFYKTNSSYVNSGTVGEFKPLRWTETTVEEVINNSKLKYIQLCSTADIETDANGFLTNSLTLPENLQIKTIVSVEPQGNMPALMMTYLVQYFPALVSGQHTLKIRLLGTDGLPLASKSAGTFTDMGVLTLFYFD